ncbi:tyrosine-type recombinase/integrase [Azospirillum melinis]|uniref:tyrosine-type recombinase/integrase n=1 Tax=Azospirillum melinis TaxID=328839 RepID=UPI0037572B32
MPVFTAKFLSGVQPPASGRIELVDDSLPGFILRITPTGAKTWAVRYKVRGKSEPQRRYTIGPYPAVSLATARERARQILEAAHGGIDLPAQEAGAEAAAQKAAEEAAELTIEKLSDRYLTEYRAHSRASSSENCERELRYLTNDMGAAVVSTVTADDVKALVRRLTKDKPVMAARVWGRARAFLAWAVEANIIAVNPCASVSRRSLQRSLILRREEPRDRALSDDELRRVLAACEAIGYPSGWYVRMLVLTGQRRDEVREMPWKEISGDDWVIAPARYKTRISQLVPLPSQARELLRAVKAIQPEGREFVFTSSHKPKKAYSSTHEVKKRIDGISGVEGWTLHDIRRTVRSGMGRIGIPRDTAERVLGHLVGGKLDRVYDVYDYRKEKAEALQAWADHLDSITRRSAS